MNEFQIKRQNKIERYKALALKNQSEAVKLSNEASKIQSFIPMGQPILVGHHSEKRHRRDIQKIESKMDRMSEAFNKAEYYNQKAAAAENNTSIFTEDPEALEKIEDKIKALENLRDVYKNFNKTWKKDGLNKAIENYPFNKKRILKDIEVICTRWNPEKQCSEFFDTKGLPSYMLTNLGAKIRRYKQKFESLEKIQEISNENQTWLSNSLCEVKIEDMRINVYFNGIPDASIRQKLKTYPLSLKWSPTRKAWTRIISENMNLSYYKDQITNALKV